MKRHTAEAIARTAIPYSGLIDGSIALRADDLEYRHLAGAVLGYLFTNLLMPVYAQYPDLQPGEFDAAQPPTGAPPGETSAHSGVDALRIANSLANDLMRIDILITEDDSIREKERARSELAEIFDHLNALRHFLDPLM